ncbi:MAG TPA: hypothetical protein VN249_09795 [Prolixibacteraceae bacterium]|nr:hypothetical protein [Prolixibacteraceae bacterium]
MELIEKQSNDTVYLHINRFANEYDNFLTIGYFEKLKQTNIGKEFLFLGNDKYNENNLRDLASGSFRYDIPAGAKLKCIDYLFPDSTNNHIITIFNHPDYGKLFVFFHHGGWNKLVTREDYDASNSKSKQLVKKYGRKDAERIRDGFVAIGFTKQMCLESWGEPDKINITKSNNGSGADWGTKRKFGTIEEWIYSGTFSNGYLYFENGVLTRMQN